MLLLLLMRMFKLFLLEIDFAGAGVALVSFFFLAQENTNKAVIADLFVTTPEHSTSAFAAIAFFNGFAGTVYPFYL